jgi:hypothetical protein
VRDGGVGHSCDEDVTTSRFGPDKRRPFGAVIEGASQFVDQDLDVVRLHVGLGPHVRQDLVVGDHFAGAIEETGQQQGGLAGQRDDPPGPAEGVYARVEPEWRKVFHQAAWWPGASGSYRGGRAAGEWTLGQVESRDVVGITGSHGASEGSRADPSGVRCWDCRRVRQAGCMQCMSTPVWW